MNVYKRITPVIVILLLTVLFAGLVTVHTAIPAAAQSSPFEVQGTAVPAAAQSSSTEVQDTEMQYRYNVQHTGDYSPVAGSTPSNGQLKWSFPTGDWTTPVAVANGVVYGSTPVQVAQGIYNMYVYALNATTGAVVWQYMTGGGPSGAPTVANGVVYLSGGYGYLYALNATTGAVVWNTKTGGGGAPTVVNGMVYVQGGGGWVVALNATTGAIAWNYYVGDYSSVTPPAVVNGIVYTEGSGPGRGVFALNASDGALVWYHPTIAGTSSPAVANGVIYVGSTDHNIYALDASNGTDKWHFTTGDAVECSAAVAKGVVYIGSDDHFVYALNALSGAVMWTFKTGNEVAHYSPSYANGVVYAGSNDGNLYALDAVTGAEVWRYGLGPADSPAVVNGVVYAGTSSNNIWAIGNETQTPPPPPLIPLNSTVPPSASTLTETLLEQRGTITDGTVTGNLTGNFSFTDFTIVNVTTGSFAGTGFSTGNWTATLGSDSYSGVWQGVTYAQPSEGRVYLKGTVSPSPSSGYDDVRGAVDGYLTESVPGSGTYDQYHATWTMNYLNYANVFANLTLDGVVSYQGSTTYPATRLHALQTSVNGTASGDYTDPLDVVVTHLRVDDASNPHNGEGLFILSYTTPTGSGEGWAYGSVSAPNVTTLDGFLTEPLWSIISGTLTETPSQTALAVGIERLDKGLAPMPDLSVYVWGPLNVSPGQTVTYLVKYYNAGPITADNKFVTALLPPEIVYQSSTSGGVHDLMDNSVTWSLPTISSRSGGELTVTGSVSLGTPAQASLNVTAFFPSQETVVEPGDPNLVSNANIVANTAQQFVASGTITNASTGQVAERWTLSIAPENAPDTDYSPASLVADAQGLNATASMGMPFVNQAGGISWMNVTLVLNATPSSSSSAARATGASLRAAFSAAGGSSSLLYQGQGSEAPFCNVEQPYMTIYDALALVASVVPGEAGEVIGPGVGGALSGYDAGVYTGDMVNMIEYAHHEMTEGRISQAQFYTYALFAIDMTIARYLIDTLTVGFGIVAVVVLGGMGLVAGTAVTLGGILLNKLLDYGGKLMAIDMGEAKLAHKLNQGQTHFLTSATSKEAALNLYASEYKDWRDTPIACDPNGQLNSRGWTSQVVPARDPNFKTGPNGYVSAGQTLNYAVEFSNVGEGTAYGVYVTDTLDQNLDAATLQVGPMKNVTTGQAISAPGTYDPATRTITWMVGEVGPQQDGYADISANVLNGAPDGTAIINSATVYFPSVPEVTPTNGIVSIVGRPPTALSAGVRATSFGIGQLFSISGMLYNASDGSPVTGATVQLQKLVNGAWTDVSGKTATTDNGGNYSITTSESVKQTYEYRTTYSGTRYEGSTAHAAANSAEVIVLVQGTPTHLAITAPSLAGAGAAFSITGNLTANGAPVPNAIIALQKNVSGKWTDVAGKTNTTTATGAYRISTSELLNGTYQYRTTYVGNATFFGSNSTSVSVKVVSKASVLQDLATLRTTLNGLPNSAFQSGTKVTLLTQLSGAAYLTSKNNYGAAAATLQNAVLPQMDGCAKTGRPDGNDAVRTCAAQGQLYPQVQNLIHELQALQGS